jgi:hypothetical protein
MGIRRRKFPRQHTRPARWFLPDGWIRPRVQTAPPTGGSPSPRAVHGHPATGAGPRGGGDDDARRSAPVRRQLRWRRLTATPTRGGAWGGGLAAGAASDASLSVSRGADRGQRADRPGRPDARGRFDPGCGGGGRGLGGDPVVTAAI